MLHVWTLINSSSYAFCQSLFSTSVPFVDVCRLCVLYVLHHIPAPHLVAVVEFVDSGPFASYPSLQSWTEQRHALAFCLALCLFTRRSPWFFIFILRLARLFVDYRAVGFQVLLHG